ncbi:MAG TPA: ParB/RepB/Spo0J family partition protein [Pyrinomonadaceae bacterium]
MQTEQARVNLSDIVFSKTNRQVSETDDDLKELAKSIKRLGVVQPIVVRPKGKKFEVVAGERRARAARLAGLLAVPAVVREMSDAEALEVQLVENVQRKNLNPVEEAEGLKRLRDELGYTVSEIAERTGKTDAYVYMTLSICDLPTQALAAVRNGRITKSVAMEIGKLPTRELKVMATAAVMPPEWDKGVTEPTTLAAAKSLIKQLLASEDSKGKRGRTAGKGRADSVAQTGKADYRKDWRFYLVRFNSDQFIEWRTIVNKRDDVETMADAVDVVMRQYEARARAGAVATVPAPTAGRATRP